MEEVTAGECRGQSVHACWASDIGNVRAANEDAVRVVPEQGLFIVSDGMGGEYAGGYAAELVVGRMPILLREHLAHLSRPNGQGLLAAIQDAVRQLNRCVREESSQLDGPRRMGATLAMALVQAETTCLAHMGDSRIYRFSSGRLELLTEDHSLVASLCSEGVISRHEARYHPLRGQLYRFVGMGGEGTADLKTIAWNPGELLLLCTDGVNEVLYDDDIRRILRAHEDLADACAALVEESKKAGSSDNITVLLAERTAP